MKLIDSIRRHVTELLDASSEEISGWRRLLKHRIEVAIFCLRRLRQDNAMAMTSALSFRTIFALVPALVLAMLVLSSFKVFGDREQHLARIMEITGLNEIRLEWEPDDGGPTTRPEQSATRPERQRSTRTAEAATQPATTTASGEGRRGRWLHGQRDRSMNLGEWLGRTIDRLQQKLTLGRIGPIGTIVLIWTALTLLMTMESSLNRIFGARRGRSIARRLLLYWSVVTLGPVLMTAGFIMARTAVATMESTPVLSWLLRSAGWLGSLGVYIILVALLYTLMPNTRVKFRASLAGAVVAVPLWMIAKWAFGVYVSQLVGKGSVYGALGLLPLFLFWVNLSWLAFLFGAELAYVEQNLSVMKAEQRAEQFVVEPADLLAVAFAVGEPFLAGRGPVAQSAIAERLNLPDRSVNSLLDRLLDRGLVCQVESGENEPSRFVLALPPDRMPVESILLDIEPEAQASVRRYPDPAVNSAIERVRSRSHQAMGGWTLAEVLSPPAQSA